MLPSRQTSFYYFARLPKREHITLESKSGNIGDSFFVFITGTTVILLYRAAADEGISALPYLLLQRGRGA